MRTARKLKQIKSANSAPFTFQFAKKLLLPILLCIWLLIKIGNLPFAVAKKLSKKITPLKFIFAIKRNLKRKLFSFLRLVKAFRRFLISLMRGKAYFRLRLFIILLGLIFYSSSLLKFSADLPSPYHLTSHRPLTTQIYDRNGKLLYQFYDGQNRKLVKLSELPPYLTNATIAIEDKHFFVHPGVDPFGIIRALKTNFTDHALQGGSTITQQLVKNTLLSTEKTYTRKIKEVVLALWAESVYTKPEILTMYLNEAPYGGPARGIEAAAETYFGKQAKDLSLAESAYLAGLPASPSEYSPYGQNPNSGLERQKAVLKRMVEDGYITPPQAAKTALESLNFKSPVQNIKAPHFVMYVKQMLADKYGERTVSEGGLKVYTTLDLDIQEAVESIVSEQAKDLVRYRVGNAAAMVTNPKNGQILAMLGSKDYFDPLLGNFNVTTALRQPGSSIKPITYSVAFEQGYSPGNVLLDTPTSFPNPYGRAYSPVNYDGTFHGPVTIRTALGSSYNIPAVKMLSIVGVDKMLDKAKDLGLTTLNDRSQYGLSLTLGGGAVKMVDMMSVYGSFATGGIYYPSQAILKVVDSYGNLIEDNNEPAGKREVSEEAAFMINSILSDNNARTPAFGPNSLLKINNKTVAVKTGTSDDKRDNWTFGYTPQYVVGTWVGNNDNSPMDRSLTSGVTGAAPIWHDIMSNLTADRPDLAFSRPGNIAEGLVDGHKDWVVAGAGQKSMVASKKFKQKDDKNGKESEIITYSDPFSNYIPKMQVTQ